jgi:hypothetical protein
VSIDDLLSSETLLSIAEKENKSNISSICDLLFGVVDVCSFLLIVLPLYPNTMDGYIYSVSLLAYTEGASWIRFMYWILFLALILSGVVKILFEQMKREQNVITGCSIILSILTITILSLTRASYAIIIIFLLLVIKAILLFKKI